MPSNRSKLNPYKRIVTWPLVGLFSLLLVDRSCSQQQQIETKKQEALLRKFANEWVEIKPGTEKFPGEIEVIQAKTGKKQSVKLNEVFSVSRYEVTQELWQTVMGNNPSRWKGNRNSVEMVDFSEAVNFCDRLTKMLQTQKLIRPNQWVRLPTEIEWEYVARAGTKTRFSFGEDTKELGDYGWFTGNAAGNDPPVGAKKPNPWGLYDVHGYLWEICIDSFATEHPLVHLPSQHWSVKKTSPVLRGGSWKDKADKLASDFRLKAKQDGKDDAVGLRCVLVSK